MQSIPITSLTSSALRNGDFKELLPEYYALVKVEENGSWHAHQNCFDHVIKVFTAYEKILQFNFLSPDQKQKIDAYLDQKLTTHTYKDLLTLTVLLHDIAKTETLITHADGTANCPGHDLIGAARMKDFAERFDLSEIEIGRLERMVRYHSFVSDIVERIRETKNTTHEYQLFETTVRDISLELMIFIYADLQGCDLDQGKPELYKQYEQIEIDYIRNYLSQV